MNLNLAKSIIFEKLKIIYSIFFREFSNVLARAYFVNSVANSKGLSEKS